MSIKDFENADGHVDWDAYNADEVSQGNRCMTCGTYIMNIGLFRDPVLAVQDCVDCRTMKASDEEVTHGLYVRCPKCKHTWNPGECDDHHVFSSEDEHEMWCGECDHKFDVITHISYEFRSPALVKESDSG